MKQNGMEVAPGVDATVARFLAALERRDFDRLESCLAPDVWFRALLPKGQRECNTAHDAVAAYRSWYGDATASELVRAERYTMAGREFLSYRFRLRPHWAPEQWHLIEQAGFCRVKEGRVTRLDVVCTGFHAVEEDQRGVAAPAGGVTSRRSPRASTLACAALDV